MCHPNLLKNYPSFSTLVRYANLWLRRHPAVQLKAAETIELNGASAPDVKHTATSRHHAAKYQHSRFWALRYILIMVSGICLSMLISKVF